MAKRPARRHTRKQPGKSVRKASRKSKISGKKRAAATKSKSRAGGGKGGVGGGGKGSPVSNQARAVTMLTLAHEMLQPLIADFPADRATFQTAPTDNHLLWTMGHLCTAYSWFASEIDGKAADMPENYNGLFGYGSKPVPDAGVYPPMSEIMQVCKRAYQRVMDAITGLSEADFDKPPVSGASGFAKTKMDVVSRLAWHEGWHQGQLSTLRRALGLKNTF